MLPHTLIPWLFSNRTEAEIASIAGAPAAIKQLWKHLRVHAPAWDPCPGVDIDNGTIENILPIGVHGDDFRFTQGGEKLLAISLSFPLGNKRLRFPLFVIRAEPWNPLSSVFYVYHVQQIHSHHERMYLYCKFSWTVCMHLYTCDPHRHILT